MTCKLDSDDCVDLLSLLKVFNAIGQEQAWALCYQMCKLLHNSWQQQQQHHLHTSDKNDPTSITNTNNDRLQSCVHRTQVCHTITGLDQIFIHKDGYVHEKTCFIVPQSSECSQAPSHHHHLHQHQHQRRPASNEGELVSSLGLALFLALDYGLSDDEERTLSQELEIILYELTVSMAISLTQVLDVCIDRLPTPTPSQADNHYRAQCRSLVLDALELSEFLDRIYNATKLSEEYALSGDADTVDAGFHDQDLDDLEPLASLKVLRISEWARLWMQVIRELRQREQFKSRLVC